MTPVFQRNVRLILAARGMSQVDLARRLRVKRATVNAQLWKPGGFQLATIQRYAEALGVPVSTLIEADAVQVTIRGETKGGD